MRIIALHYLPQPAYIALLMSFDDLLIDTHEYFVKQTYRNRTTILGPNGIKALTVPVQNAGKKMPAKEVKIDYSQKWINQHWRTIQAAYGRAPYFEYFADDFLRIYQKKHPFLFDLNHELLTQCLDFLQIDINLQFTTQYIDLKNEPEKDYRSLISPKTTTPLPISFRLPNYPQVFGNKFATPLSIIDLIFCEGPNGGSLLRNSVTIEQKRI